MAVAGLVSGVISGQSAADRIRGQPDGSQRAAERRWPPDTRANIQNGLIRYAKQAEILAHVIHVMAGLQSFTRVTQVETPISLAYRIYSF